MKRLLAIITLLAAVLSLAAQQTHVKAPYIGRVSLAVNGDEARQPILTLNGNEQLTISFDALTPEQQRFTWRVEHCDVDWHTTDALFESEYLAAPPEGEPIADYQESLLTATLYTHYTFSIPSDNGTARPLLSGNYRVSVYDESNDNEPVLSACFMVVDKRAKLTLQLTADTDIDYRREHQQLSVTADLGALTLINANDEVRLLCQQNRSQHFTLQAPPPTYIIGSTLRWDHCRALIFPAGNEYRKFEMPSTRVPGMHIDRLLYDGEGYAAALLPDQPYRDYYYDEDQNGRALIYTERSNNADTEADYVLTHFTLATEQLPQAEIYIDGWWADGSDDYLMTYNPEAQAYEADILLKQGYYSYRYLAVESRNNQTALVYNLDGNYYQTENEYTLYLYYRPVGTRYWQLIATHNTNYKL